MCKGCEPGQTDCRPYSRRLESLIVFFTKATFQGLFLDHIKADLDGTIFAYDYRARLACVMPLGFQGPPTRNIIPQIVQKCTFPVYSNNTLSL